MRRLLKSTLRWPLATIMLPGRVATAALLTVTVLVVLVGLVGLGTRPLGVTANVISSSVRTARQGSGNNEYARPGSFDRATQQARLDGSEGADWAGRFSATKGASCPQRADGNGQSGSELATGADAFLLAALERLEQQIAAAMVLARVGGGAGVHCG